MSNLQIRNQKHEESSNLLKAMQLITDGTSIGPWQSGRKAPHLSYLYDPETLHLRTWSRHFMPFHVVLDKSPQA